MDLSTIKFLQELYYKYWVFNKLSERYHVRVVRLLLKRKCGNCFYLHNVSIPRRFKTVLKTGSLNASAGTQHIKRDI